VPVTSLLRSLAGDAATLTRKEVALARSEMTRAVGDLKTGIVSAATGGSVLYAGLLFLLLSATLGLATVMDGWLAALIVGGVVTVIGLILVGTAKKKLEAENFRPDRTVDAMRKDQEMLHRRTSR
jgi:xanthine/uracil permease